MLSTLSFCPFVLLSWREISFLSRQIQVAGVGVPCCYDCPFVLLSFGRISVLLRQFKLAGVEVPCCNNCLVVLLSFRKISVPIKTIKTNPVSGGGGDMLLQLSFCPVVLNGESAYGSRLLRHILLAGSGVPFYNNRHCVHESCRDITVLSRQHQLAAVGVLCSKNCPFDILSSREVSALSRQIQRQFQ